MSASYFSAQMSRHFGSSSLLHATEYSQSHETQEIAVSLQSILCDVLHTIRLRMGMDVAFIAEFIGGQRVYRYTSHNTERPLIDVGSSDPLEDSFCQRVVDGRLPELIQDVLLLPEARELLTKTDLPIRAQIDVPIWLSDGSLYGTFCCFSPFPKKSLTEFDLNISHAFAEFCGKQIEKHIGKHQEIQSISERIEAVLEQRNFNTFYQPIFNVKHNKVVGYEALTRFSAEPIRSPDMWFSDAKRVNLQIQLEIATTEKALENFHRLPKESYLSLNMSPRTILSGQVERVLAGYPLDRLVLELTEHEVIEDYAIVSKILEPLRQKGLRLAVDDTGAGYSTFSHVIELDPDIIKLDRSLVRDIDTKDDVYALAACLIRFAEETDCRIIAEGVETASELAALSTLNVNKAQGFFLARPLPIESLCCN